MEKGLVRARGVAVDHAAGRLPEQERSQLLTYGSRRGVVERSPGEVGVEIVAAGGVTQTGRVLAVRAEVVPHTELVSLADDFGQGRLERVNVVVGNAADTVTEKGVRAD